MSEEPEQFHMDRTDSDNTASPSPPPTSQTSSSCEDETEPHTTVGNGEPSTSTKPKPIPNKTTKPSPDVSDLSGSPFEILTMESFTPKLEVIGSLSEIAWCIDNETPAAAIPEVSESADKDHGVHILAPPEEANATEADSAEEKRICERYTHLKRLPVPPFKPSFQFHIIEFKCVEDQKMRFIYRIVDPKMIVPQSHISIKHALYAIRKSEIVIGQMLPHFGGKDGMVQAIKKNDVGRNPLEHIYFPEHFLKFDKTTILKCHYDDKPIPIHIMAFKKCPNLFVDIIYHVDLDKHFNSWTFIEFLRFLYCGKIECTGTATLIVLLRAAKYYKYKTLEVFCEKELSQRISD